MFEQIIPHSSQSGERTKRDNGCPRRMERALAKYQSLLQQGLCVCRSVLSRASPCCSKENRTSYIVQPNKNNRGRSRNGLQCSSSVKATSTKERSQKVSSSKDSLVTTNRKCTEDNLTLSEACCRQAEPVSHQSCSPNNTSCEILRAENNQVKNMLFNTIHTESANKDHQVIDAGGMADLEKGWKLDEVVLSIDGMTCTGCARKVIGVLSRISGVCNVNVSFITAKGEFQFSPQLATLSDIVTQLKQETGFEFTYIQTDLQSLDLVMPQESAITWMKSLPNGVDSVEQINKIYRVTYDPTRIGARAVLGASGAQTLGPPCDDSTVLAHKKRLLKMGVSFAVAMVFTIPVVVLGWSNNSVPYGTRSIIVFILATLVQAVAVPEFYLSAIKSLIYSHIIEIDMLVTISITAAYLYSVVAFGLTHAGYVLEQGEIFETSTLLITLVILGRLVSTYAKHKAIAAMSLKSLQASTAQLLTSQGQPQEIDARLLQYGDILLVPSHSRIVTDGEVIAGTSSVDESTHTGESIPMLKEVGHNVIAGTMNGEGTLTIRITRLPGKNSITDIAGLVEAALSTKPKVQDLADNVAGYFTPVVVIISVVVFIIWVAVLFKIRESPGGSAVGTALTYSIAVLAVSCPCALGLAVPMVLIIAGGLGARSGIIIKRADAIEKGHKITDVVFDKTGTLTYSEMQVQENVSISTTFDKSELDSLTHGLVKNNIHPVSIAISKYLDAKGVPVAPLELLQSIPGKGLEAQWKGMKIRAGNPSWLEVSEHAQIVSRAQLGETLFCVTMDASLVAIYCLKSAVRTEALSIVRELQTRGIACHIVSGDSPLAVVDIASKLGISAGNTMSRHSPAEKQKYVQVLVDSGRWVLFCGDGTNDAVAVAQAHIGVQFGNTSDMTNATADVVLLGGLEGITKLLDISKAAFRRIIFNFVWSAIYNVFAISLAAGAFVTVRIPPAYAGLGEIVSVLPVVFAALTLSLLRW